MEKIIVNNINLQSLLQLLINKSNYQFQDITCHIFYFFQSCKGIRVIVEILLSFFQDISQLSIDTFLQNLLLISIPNKINYQSDKNKEYNDFYTSSLKVANILLSHNMNQYGIKTFLHPIFGKFISHIILASLERNIIDYDIPKDILELINRNDILFYNQYLIPEKQNSNLFEMPIVMGIYPHLSLGEAPIKSRGGGNRSNKQFECKSYCRLDGTRRIGGQYVDKVTSAVPPCFGVGPPGIKWILYNSNNKSTFIRAMSKLNFPLPQLVALIAPYPETLMDTIYDSFASRQLVIDQVNASIGRGAMCLGSINNIDYNFFLFNDKVTHGNFTVHPPLGSASPDLRIYIIPFSTKPGIFFDIKKIKLYFNF